MKKVFSIVAAVFMLPVLTFAQRSNIDHVVTRFQKFYNAEKFDSIGNMLSDRSKTIMPVDKLATAMNQLYLQAGELKGFELTKISEKLFYYKVTFSNAPLTLLASVNNDDKLETFRFMPYKPESKETVEKSNYILTSSTGSIYGSLTMPDDSSQKVPVVLLIAGSGPTDRNCNNNLNLKTNAFRMIADSLKAAGIACVRYDKRGVGESESAMSDPTLLTLDSYIDDAVGFIKMLKNDKRFSSVVVAGHSEGALIGMIAVQKEKPSKFISMAGAGEPLDHILLSQYSAQSKELASQAAKILDTLKMGKDAKNVPGALLSVFMPSLQPFIRSVLKYHPQTELRKVQIPVMIIQGDNDLQVKLTNAVKLKGASPKARLEVIPGMNHALKDAPEERALNFATYSDGTLPINGRFSRALISFVKG